MVGMLPGGVAGLLGLVGVGASSGVAIWLASNLATVGAPLLIASTVVLAVASLSCSRLAVSVALAGGALMYLSMYVITQGGATTPALFYPGLTLFVGAYVVPVAQRRRGRCRPLVTPKHGRGLLVVALIVGAALIVATAAFGISLGVSSGAMSGMGG